MLVVADDLGGGNGKDAAILELLSAGLVDAASLLPNGPSFGDAAAAAAAHSERVGVHLVLTEGEPLTDAIRRERRFCDADGRFRLWRGAERALWLGAEARRMVRAEWLAQVERVRDAGFAAAHLDSHHHVHTEPALAGVVIALARELEVARVRLARNWGAGLGPANRAWKRLFNARLRRAGLAGTRWFGGLADYLDRADRRPDADDFELMVHPVRTGSTIEDEEYPGPLADRLLRLRSP